MGMMLTVLKKHGFPILIAVIASAAHAQQKPQLPGGYPNKPLRIIVASAPGGSTDFTARLIMGKLGERWGVPVVIENRSGAIGAIGVDLVAKGNPDGYTLLAAPKSGLINVSLISQVPYDVRKDLAPVTRFNSQPYLLTVNMSVPASSVKELIAHARSKPGALNYASTGPGSTAHLAMELFNSMAGIKMEHIPYKGGGPGLTALMGGHVQLLFSGATGVMPHAKSGKLKLLGVSSLKRSRLLPDLPTVAESGLPGFESTGWYGLLAPVRTPPAIVAALNREVVLILNQPAMQEAFAADGAEIAPDTPAEFKGIINKEFEELAKLIKNLNLKL